MPILTSRARAQGGSLSITVPAEARRRMGVNPGDDLYWVEDGMGGYRVTPSNPSRAALLRAHGEIMREYRHTFAALAK